MRALLLALVLTPATAFAWPIKLNGTVEFTTPFGVSGSDVGIELNRNGTGTAVFLGAPGALIPVRWMRDPAGSVWIEVSGVATFSGVPSRGCVRGSNDQPTPLFLVPFIAAPTVGVSWALCT